MFAGWTHSDWLGLSSLIASIGLGIAVVAATFRGPIIAAQEADARRAKADLRADKMRVFRELMGHRYDVKHPNYVGALNLVQIEFADVEPVMNAFQSYLLAFHADTTPKADCLDIRRKAIVRLLGAIGTHLGYKLEQLDLMEQVYSPQEWANVAEQQRQVRELFADIGSGKRALPVLTVVPPIFVEKLDEERAAIRTTQAPPARPKRAPRT